MTSEALMRLVAVIGALHVAVLSIVFGLRHLGYILAATLSAALIWGGVFFLNERKQRAGIIAGFVLCVTVQQIAYQAWKTQLTDLGWALAQFAALQFLTANILRRAAQ